MIRNNGLFIILGVVTLLAGCWTTKPTYEQRFLGVVMQEKKPVASARVKLLTPKADSCSTKGLETETDKRGRFQVERLTKYDESARSYQLCVMADNKWQSVWSQSKGPTPKSVEFQCDLADRSSDKCWVSWNKDGFKKGSWSR